MRGARESTPRPTPGRTRHQPAGGTARIPWVVILATALLAFNFAGAVHDTEHATHVEEASCELCPAFSGSAIVTGEWWLPTDGVDATRPATPSSPLLSLRPLRIQCRGPPAVSMLGTH